MRRALFIFLLTALLPAPSSAQTSCGADPCPSTTLAAGGPRIGSAIANSFALLVVEHGIRVALQTKTRREPEGPFWRDYADSLHVPRSWEDRDRWYVNYLGHPIHGAAAGFVWMEHDPISRDAEFGLNGRYWATRWRPLVWSATYSVQFELGPISERRSATSAFMAVTSAGWTTSSRRWAASA